MKGWNWINKDGFNLTNIAYEIDTTQEQVACTKVPSYGYAWTGSYVFSSIDGAVTGPVADKPVEQVYFQWMGLNIDSKYDSLMFYVELPDFEKSGAEWALGINGLGLDQSGSTHYANMNNDAKFSYLSIFDDKWQEGTIKGGASESERYFQGLPSGFRGYILLNFENFKYWETIDLDSAYTLSYLYLTLNSVGGECGDALFGGIMYVPNNDGNTTIMRIDGDSYDLKRLVGGDVTLVYNDGVTENKVYTNNAINDIITLPTPEREGYTFDGWYYDDGTFMKPVAANFSVSALGKVFYAKWIDNTIPGDLDGDGKISAVDLVVLKKVILEVEDEFKLSAADVNGDGEVDVRDLVKLMKSIV